MTSASRTSQAPYSEVGQPIPAGEHSVSVSLPTWQDTMNYKLHEPETIGRMQVGYPRFFIPRIVQKLAEQLEQAFALPSECSLLVCSTSAADACHNFLLQKGAPARVVTLRSLDSRLGSEISMVVFPVDFFPVAFVFWQHTGLGISSRFGQRYLSLLESIDDPRSLMSGPEEPLHSTKDTSDHHTSSKRILRSRIASLITHNCECTIHQGLKSSRLPVNENDIFIYPSGMSAIWSAHQLLLNTFGARQSVCFGFPYTDTLKVLEKWGPDCRFYPDGDEASIDSLEAMLSSQRGLSSEPPILALFTEFPSNPLLRSVNLRRLRALADKHGFPIVIDDTVGNFVNVDVLPFVDIVATSLTKIFSGCANAMGGSLTLNPLGKHYTKLKYELQQTWKDTYFEEDADAMEHNSRTFCDRIAQIDHNTEIICEFLRGCTRIVSRVYYPKWQTRELYDACRSTFADGRKGGFGGLFSIVFSSPEAAHSFFDALHCAKGPSLGTNFTLACPYALYGHFDELEWAEKYGVPRDIVRVSIGTEETDFLLNVFTAAVRAAEETHALCLNATSEADSVSCAKL